MQLIVALVVGFVVAVAGHLLATTINEPLMYLAARGRSDIVGIIWVGSQIALPVGGFFLGFAQMLQYMNLQTKT